MSSRAASYRPAEVTRIIACTVFKPALEHLQLMARYPGVRVSYLPSNLHMGPQKLRDYILRRIASAHKRKERTICLYGDCFPHIDEFCQLHRTIKVPGCHCYQMLLGSECYSRLIDETAGTYFLERDLILNFEHYCVEPLELHDLEMRKCCFEHYRRLLYVRQPSDPNLVPKAGQLAEFLELSLQVEDADYSFLEQELVRLIEVALS